MNFIVKIMKNKKADNPENKIQRGLRRQNNYLEIYITQDGSIMLTPVTSRTKVLVEKISGRNSEPDNVYCG